MSTKKPATGRKAKPSPRSAAADATPLRTAAVLLGIIYAGYERIENVALVDALRGVAESVRGWVVVTEDKRDLTDRVYEALSLLGTLSLHAESPDWESVVGGYCDPVWNITGVAKRLLEEAYADPFQTTNSPESAEEAA